MNYLKEIIAFYDRQVQQPLSASAITLWHALMYINNKTRWKNTFTAAGTFLQFIGGLTESSFKRARAELVEYGYIEYESLGRGKAPRYKMKSLVIEMEVPDYFQKDDPEPMVPTDVSNRLVNQQSGFSDQEVNQDKDQLIDDSYVSFMTQENEALSKKEMQAEYNASNPSFKPQEYQALGGFSFQRQPKRFSYQPITQQANDDFSPSNVSQPVTRNVAETTDEPMNDLTNELVDHLPDQHVAPLNKQNINKRNTKQNKTNQTAEKTRGEIVYEQQMNHHPQTNEPDAIQFYQENFGIASPFVAEALLDWTRELGDELVIEAMKRALERNKTTWGYVKAILTAWCNKGIRTVEQARAEQVAFENRQKKKKAQRMGFGVGGKKEVIPDWFYEQKREREERERSMGEQRATMEDLERVKREFLEGRKAVG